MKCSRCGYETFEFVPFCPKCGSTMEMESTASPAQSFSAPVEGSSLSSALKDALFLVLCILISVYCILSLAMGSLPLFHILAVIFLWLTFAEAKKEKLPASHLRTLSGVTYAAMLTSIIAGIIVAVCGVVICLLMANSSYREMARIIEELDNSGLDVEFYLRDLLNTVGNAGDLGLRSMVDVFNFIGIVMIGVGIGISIFAFLSIRPIHQFLQTVYKHAEQTGTVITGAKKAKTWLMVMGVFAALSVFGSNGALPLMTNLALAGTLIVGSILIGKHFSE